jgi:transcriptional regulator with GAF, ATPase, and Fis domain
MDGVSSSGFAALESLAPALLGAGGLLEAQERLARGMLAAALERTSANYTRTAQLLGVRRQAVQQMVTRFALESCVVRLRGTPPARARD